MRWERLGLVLELARSPFASRFVSHAQSPQAVVFPGFVRVYFSTRTRSANGKAVSHVQWVDYDHGLREARRHSEGEVLAPGAPGTFDEHGVFPFSPTTVGDRLVAYTTGWTRRVAVDVDSGVGLVESDDGGETFRRLGDGPVLAASLREPYLVCDGFVRPWGGLLHMFYVFGTGWRRPAEAAPAERTYVIGHATSADGVHWTRSGRPVIPTVREGECQALPTVLRRGDRYHMYFCHRASVDFRSNPRNAYRLGYAHSDDLENWVRDDEAGGLQPSAGGWDSEMMCYPHLFECGGEVYLLYNGNGFGRDGFGAARLREGAT